MFREDCKHIILRKDCQMYPLNRKMVQWKLESQDRCCLIDLLLILEGRQKRWKSADCCDKIDAALEYVRAHLNNSEHSVSVQWTGGGNDGDEKGVKRDPSGKEIIAVYPGRFQPMGKHHKATYDWMVSMFGEENSFIVTSNKVRLPKSPLNFDDKKMVAQAMGIPGRAIKQETNVYAPPLFSFMKERDLQNTAVIVVVGEKDMATNPRFKNVDGTKKDNITPAYYKHYDPKIDLARFEDHGYIIIAPHQELDVRGIEMSGTTLRSFLPKAKKENFKEWLDISDGATIAMLQKKLGATP